ncbi:MAG: DEAD/DEAH box helicase [Colwellia sp.]|nr:DEAD/DEAH box helicase [Colwellia sp.]
MFSKSKLKDKFALVTWNRGLHLFRSHNVLSVAKEGDLIRGSVRSATNAQVTYLSVIEVIDDEIFTRCTCPVGRYCKHAVAIGHEFLNSHHTAADDKEVEQWLTSLKNTQQDKTSRKKVIVYLLEYKKSQGQKKLFVQVKISAYMKNGGFSKSLQNVYNTTDLFNKPFVSDDDIQIISLLMKENEVNYQRQCNDFSILALLIKSGRSFWQSCTNLDDPLVLGEPIKAEWQWITLEDNLTSLKLVLPNHYSDVDLFQTKPISYYDLENNAFGIIETNIDAELAPQLLSSPVFNEQQIPWVVSQLRVSLGNEAEKLPQPKISSEIKMVVPVPELKLTTPIENTPTHGEIILTFNYQGHSINPNQESPTIDINDDKKKRIYRDLAYENQVIDTLIEHQFKMGEKFTYSYWQDKINQCTFRLQAKEVWYEFMHNTIPVLEAKGWVIEFADNFYYQELLTNGHFEAELKDYENSHDFFSIGLNLDINGQKLPAFPILQSAIKQLPKSLLTESESNNNIDEEASIFIDMEKGNFLTLKYKTIKPLLRQFIELFIPNSLDENGMMKLSRFQGHQTLSLLDDQGVIAKGAEKIRLLAAKLESFDGIKNIEPAKNLDAKLRVYQQQGVNWLQFLREYQLSGILADDMGLGKTVQALAHLAIEKEQGRLTSPCLIIAPTSVIFNWANEIKKFTPFLTYNLIHGPQRKVHLDDFSQYDIIITSYPLIVKDFEFYSQQAFYYLILDEAHYIKNPKTRLYEAIIKLKTEHKLCMTGTPMENHLGEFWAQFNFLLPGFLGGHNQFNKLFKTPIQVHGDHERKVLLNQRIKPFILRRTKEKIAKELPAKTEIIQTVRIEGAQAELYESVRLSMDSRLNEIIAKKGINRSQIEILDALLKLRQVCCHPQLLSLDSAKDVKQSAKLEWLMEMLPEMIDEGRKILIFSQFTSMLALIEEQLTNESIIYTKLTGATTKRQEVVENFQKGDIPVFLISLRAGGVGLNLTEADTVIHFDPWWNPAVENQATDRAHRIGQNKPVFVYKLIVENSIEEKIQLIQKEKAALANALLSEEVNEGKLSLTNNILSTLLAPL